MGACSNDHQLAIRISEPSTTGFIYNICVYIYISSQYNFIHQQWDLYRFIYIISIQVDCYEVPLPSVTPKKKTTCEARFCAISTLAWWQPGQVKMMFLQNLNEGTGKKRWNNLWTLKFCVSMYVLMKFWRCALCCGHKQLMKCTWKYICTSLLFKKGWFFLPRCF